MFGRKRPSHTALAERVDRLGLDERLLAARAQVDSRRVADALRSDIDLEAVLSIAEVKRILAVLDMDLLQLFGIPCAFCSHADASLEAVKNLPRNELVARRREKLGISQEGLLKRLGVADWFLKHSDNAWAQNRMRLWQAIEEQPDSLDDLTLDQVRLLNKGLLLPLHLLVGGRCPKCGEPTPHDRSDGHQMDSSPE
jgi:hypothetical protein